MFRSLRFAVLLVAGLGALAWVAQRVVDATTRGWYEHDVELRADLVVSAARRSLVARWGHDRAGVRTLLEDIAHDERILAAAACTADGDLLAKTDDLPAGIRCAAIARNMQPDASGGWSSRSEVAELPAGPVHLSAVPVLSGDKPLGFVVLVHDLTFVQRREAATRNFILLAFFVLAIAAASVTLIAGRLSWRNWTAELRRLLRGEGLRPEFKPLLRDVRELVERISSEKEDFSQGAWTAERLRQTLSHNLRGEKVLIVANREPYIHERSADGKVKVVHPASGLVTALEPVMRACSGTWIAHGSGVADREVSDKFGRLRVPPGEESYQLRRIWLSRAEEQGYYYGLANEGLWPLCHIAFTRPLFRASDWETYEAVNRRFADTVVAEARNERPIVLVQDYHFALLPRMIRERLPEAIVITFWHIPWPNSEVFSICPWREKILDGLLGSSIIGFHTQFHCNNFVESVDRFLESRIEREDSAISYGGETSLVHAYPISIEWPPDLLARLPSVADCRAGVRRKYGLADTVKLCVGVERLDYTKGILDRFQALDELFTQHPEWIGRLVFLQIAAPSRGTLPAYKALHDECQARAEELNRRYGSDGYKPVLMVAEHHSQRGVYEIYRAADICMVTSLHDGMNLVAKEFVAARDDEQGVLLLSTFAGASKELLEALIVNPYDAAMMGEALLQALTMEPGEQSQRMRRMREIVRDNNVYRWAGSMLLDAARLRKRSDLGHISGGDPSASGSNIISLFERQRVAAL